MARDINDLKHLLELEYDYSQKAIDKFDEYRARLKSWMITAAAGITAVAFSAHNSLIFWAGGLMVLFFGLSEMSYVDIQEDVIVRNRELKNCSTRSVDPRSGRSTMRTSLDSGKSSLGVVEC